MKKHLILLFSILIIFIAGCTPDDNGTPAGTFIGGTEGLKISFINLAPPSSFSQDDQVTLRVLLTNKGETRVQTGNAKARIFGVNLENFGLQNVYKSNLGPIEGQGEFTATGGEQEINFGQIRYSPSITNQESFTLRARLCYPYQTLVKTDVCVQSLISQESQSEVCSLTGEKVVSGSVSGAPVQVTSIIEQTRGNDQVRIDIKIENKGLGEVYSIDSKCEDLDDDIKRFDNKDKIKIKVKSPLDVKCGFRTGEPSSEGFVTLDENKAATLSCWKNVNEPIVDKLDLQLDYLYRDQATKQIIIYQKRR